MATLFKHALLCKIGNLNLKYGPIITVIRNSAIPPRRKADKRGTIKHRNLIESNEKSLAARGFLRALKPYEPPVDVVTRLTSIYQNVLGKNYHSTTSLSDRTQKFHLLNACFKEFDHSVPNSLLHTISSIDDVTKFYETPVSTTTPLDNMRNIDLPPNLHIQHEYVRFHPETDTLFNGVTAFPESSTIVTGLKYKNKYKGHTQKLPRHFDNWADFIKQT